MRPDGIPYSTMLPAMTGVHIEQVALVRVWCRINVAPTRRAARQREQASDSVYRLLQKEMVRKGLYPIERPRVEIRDDPRRLPVGRRGPWWDRYATAHITARACRVPVRPTVISEWNLHMERLGVRL